MCTCSPSSCGCRRPQGTLLHQVVQDNLGAYLEGHQVRPFVLREFNAFLRCGDIAGGSATVFCPRCDFSKDVVFSCKRRGWCTYCLEHRMLDRSAFLRRSVLGDTPVRHWVESFPPPLRYLLAYDSSLTTKVLSIHIHEIFRHLRWKAKRTLGLSSVNQAHPGAVTVIQRASANLNLNLHFHSLVTDGVFVHESPDGPVSFHELPAPTDEEVAEVAWRTCLGTRDVLARLGVWREIPDEPGETPSPTTIRGFLSLGPERTHRVVRFCAEASPQERDEPLERHGAYPFDLWARERVARGDRKGLDKLTQYILNPPFTDEQLRRDAEGRVVLELKRPRRDGTREQVFAPEEFVDKLVNLTPRPRANLIRFHGVYGAHCALRDDVVPKLKKPASPPTLDDPETAEDHLAWGNLLRRVHAVDVMRCPRCSSRLLLLSLKCDILTYRRKRGVPPDLPTAEPQQQDDLPTAA